MHKQLQCSQYDGVTAFKDLNVWGMTKPDQRVVTSQE